MRVLVRKMREGDLEAALALLAQWNMAPRLGDPTAERSGLEVEHSFVGEARGRIVGVASYLRLSSDVAETASLAVSPAVRGQGVGYRLQEARLKEMRRKGFRRVHTETDRPETIAWYVEKFGYRVVGTHPKKHEFSLPDVDSWTVLELDLAPGEAAEGEAGVGDG